MTGTCLFVFKSTNNAPLVPSNCGLSTFHMYSSKLPKNDSLDTSHLPIQPPTSNSQLQSVKQPLNFSLKARFTCLIRTKSGVCAPVNFCHVFMYCLSYLGLWGLFLRLPTYACRLRTCNLPTNEFLLTTARYTSNLFLFFSTKKAVESKYALLWFNRLKSQFGWFLSLNIV